MFTLAITAVFTIVFFIAGLILIKQGISLNKLRPEGSSGPDYASIVPIGIGVVVMAFATLVAFMVLGSGVPGTI